jgi:WD40 repeat protein
MSGSRSDTSCVDAAAEQRFEEDWAGGNPRRIEAYLPPADDPRHLPTLVALVASEMELCRRHDPLTPAPPAEHYLARFPALNQPESLWGLLCAEVRACFAYGVPPERGEYVRRFPALFAADPAREGALWEEARAADQLPRVEGYELLSWEGRGGMGQVYKARRLDMDRTVAIKVLLAGPHADAEASARFRQEAEAAARLDHPGIVKIYHVGVSEGRPFLELEFVAGGSLEQRLRRARDGPLSPSQAADLVWAVAAAAGYAHQRGILHRDLKPGNILLSADGTPKIADFGLAKRLDRDGGFTRTTAVLGTPAYMAPEQARAANPLSPAADVYSLGAILYETLTGRPPFLGDTALETLEQARSQEPVPVRRLRPKVPRDLETICLKCLRKEPGQRYASAGDLADDLLRYREGRPILARPPRLSERVVKWCRRNKAGAAAIALLVSLVAVLAGAALIINRSRSEALGRVVQLHLDDGDRELEAGQLNESLPHYVEAARLDDRDGRSHRVRLDSLFRHTTPVAVVCAHDAPVLCATFSPDGRFLLTGDSQGGVRVWDASTGRQMAGRQHKGPVRHASFSADGRRVVTASDDQTACLWSWDAGLETSLPHLDGVRRAWFALGGAKVVTVSGDVGPQAVRVWDETTGKLEEEVRLPPGEVGRLACLSPDGRHVALVTWGLPSPTGHVRALIHDLKTRKSTFIDARTLMSVDDSSFTPDSEWLLAVSHGGVYAYQAGTGRAGGLVPDEGDEGAAFRPAADSKDTAILSGKKQPRNVRLAAMSPAEKLLAAVGDNDRLYLCALPEGRVLAVPLDGDARHLAFSQDGRLVLTVLGEQRQARPDDPFTSWEIRPVSHARHEARVWDAATGYALTPPLTHNGPITAAEFARDGSKLVTAAEDGAVIVWRLQPPDAAQPVFDFVPDEGYTADRAVFTPDGRVVACVRQYEAAEPVLRPRVLSWQPDAKDPSPRTVFEGEPADEASLGEDGRYVVVGDGNDSRLYETRGGTLVARLGQPSDSGWGGPDRSGHQVLTYSGRVACLRKLPDGGARRWDTGVEIAEAHLSPDGRHVLVLGEDGGIRLRDFEAEKDGPVLTIRGGLERAVFSPDGHGLLLLGKKGASALLVDLDRGESRRVPHPGAIETACFNPDGSRLVTAGPDGLAWLRDGRTGDPLTRPLRHAGEVSLVDMSGDGRWLVTVSEAGHVVQVWDAAEGRTVTPPLRQPGPVEAVTFSPDGWHLFMAWRQSDSVPEFHVSRLDLLADGRPLDELARRAALLAGFEIDSSGNRRPIDGLRRRELWEQSRETQAQTRP